MSIMPDVFLTYQQALMSSVSTHAVTVVEKSRRTGYSWAIAAEAVLTAAAARDAGGMNVYYMGYNQEMTREFIDYCAIWAKAIEPAAAEVQETFWEDPENPDRQIKVFRISFASGFEIVALPSVARALRGKQGLVILDEAAFHDDLEEVLKAAFALLMWGGRVAVISTHNGDTNPFNVLVQDIRAGRRPYNLLRCTLDDALADGLYKRICMTTNQVWSVEAEAAWRANLILTYGQAADEELLCIPSATTGSAIPAPLIEARMVDAPVVRLARPKSFTEWAAHLREADILDWCERELAPLLAKLDPNTPHVFGHDFGRSGDLSVCWPLAIGRDLVRRTPFVVELRNIPFEQQRQILFYIADRLPLLRAGKLDATGNGGYLAEVAAQRYGEGRIEKVMMSELWYREQMPPFVAAFEDATITVPRDRDILGDLRVLSYVRGVVRVPIRTAGADGGQRHGDAAIAAALAYAASRADPEIYEYTAAPRAPAAGTGRYYQNSEDRRAADEMEDDVRHAESGFLGGIRGGILPGARGGAF